MNERFSDRANNSNWALGVLKDILDAMAHPAPSLLQGIHFLGAGLLLGFAYLLSGQIGLSIGIHTGFNFVSTYVFPTTLEPSASVFTLVVDGPTWFIGQSGLLQTGLLIPAAFAIIGYVWWQSGSIEISPEAEPKHRDGLVRD